MKGEMTLDEALSLPTVPVPDAGRLFYGLTRNQSYEAAKRGEIPTIPIGGRKKAVVASIASKLNLKTKFETA